MGQLIRPIVHTIQTRNQNHQYKGDILSQAIPKMVAHSNIGNIQHVQTIKKNIQNDRYDNLINILKSNQKAVSFDTVVPKYS